MALIVIVAESVIVAFLSVETIRTKSLEQGKQRSLQTAQLNAGLVDAHWTRIVSLLRAACEHDGFLAAVRAKNGRLAAAGLKNIMLRDPGFLCAAVYDSRGNRLACSPGEELTPARAAGTDWYATLRAGLPYVIGGTARVQGPSGPPSIGVGIPAGNGKHHDGFLLACYPWSAVESWLRPSWRGELDIAVLDGKGHLVMSSTDRPPSSALQKIGRTSTLYSGDGVTVQDAPGVGDMIVGYATASTPGWTVLAAQPIRDLVGPTDYLVRLLVIPSLVLIALAAWALFRLNRRQEEMAETLAGQNDRLRTTDEAREEFMAHVSHDLRTPLTNMRLTISDLLESEPEWDPPSARASLQSMNEDIDRITGRVRNLLEMSRLDADAWPVQKEVLDLTELAAAAIERLQAALRDRPVDTEFPSDPMLVDCDQAQIETVIVNLLENAIKYSPPGSALKLRGEVINGEAVFTLKDCGPGIEPGDESLVFNKYYRAPSVAAAGGTGLGLAICRTIVEAHGGDIGVRSPHEGGGEFWFSLPLLSIPEHDLL